MVKRGLTLGFGQNELSAIYNRHFSFFHNFSDVACVKKTPLKCLNTSCLKAAQIFFHHASTKHTSQQEAQYEGVRKEVGLWFCALLGSLFTQHSVVNSCPEYDLFAIWQDWQASCVTFCLDVGLTLIYRSAYTRAAIFNVSSLNASAVTSVILLCFCFSATLSLSCT